MTQSNTYGDRELIHCSSIHLQELANFENQPDGPKLCVEDLLRDGGFLSCGSQAMFQAFVAEAVSGGGIR